MKLTQKHTQKRTQNILLILGVVVLGLLPLWIVERPTAGPDGEAVAIFGGAYDQAKNLISRMYVEAKAMKLCLCSFDHRIHVDTTAPHEQAANKYIFRNRQFWQETHFLVDQANAHMQSIGRRGWRIRSPFPPHLRFCIWCYHAGDDRSARRPHNSPLMKLPTRPAASPSGTSGAMKSVMSSHERCHLYAQKPIARSTPRNPPWKDMPPCQMARICAGWAR